MEKKYILEKYAKYYDQIQELGKLPLSETPKRLEDIGVTRSIRQLCYNDIKELKKEGITLNNVIDYLCWICTRKSLIDFENKLKHDDLAIFQPLHFEDVDIPIDDELKKINKKYNQIGLERVAKYILSNFITTFNDDWVIGRNTVRLYNKNIDHLFSTKIIKNILKDKYKITKIDLNTIVSFFYLIYSQTDDNLDKNTINVEIRKIFNIITNFQAK